MIFFEPSIYSKFFFSQKLHPTKFSWEQNTLGVKQSWWLQIFSFSMATPREDDAERQMGATTNPGGQGRKFAFLNFETHAEAVKVRYGAMLRVMGGPKSIPIEEFSAFFQEDLQSLASVSYINMKVCQGQLQVMTSDDFSV